jgi:hypothetical protein
MTRLGYFGLLGGTALVGFGVGRLCRRETPVTPSVPPPTVVPVVRVQKVDASKVEGHDWFAEIKGTESSTEFALLWKRLDSCRLPYAFQSLLKEWLLSRWILKDAPGCLAHCNSVPNKVIPGVPWVGEALAAWAKVDIPSALARAQQIDSAYPVELRMQVNYLSRRIAELDPGGFLSNKYHLPKNLLRESTSVALETVGRRSAQEAVALASRYLSGSSSGTALGFSSKVIATSAVQQMGDAGSLDWARGLKDLPSADRRAIELEILNQMVVTNPTRALAEAAQWDWKKNGILPPGLWPLLAKKDPLQALKLASENEPGALGQLAETIAPDAATLARTLSGQEIGDAISPVSLQTSIAALPAERCRELMDQAATLPTGSVRDQIRDAALRGWAQQRPAEAMTLALNIPDEKERKTSCLVVIEALGRSSEADSTLVPGVLKLIETALPENLDAEENGEDRIAACRDALMNMAEQSPDQIWTWLQNQPDAARYNAWMPKVLAGMAVKQPEQAVKQALQMPTPEMRQDAIVETIGQWTSYDPHAASVWAKTLPPGQERATAALMLAQRIAEVEPELALPWAMESIPGIDRQGVLTRVFRQWEEDNPGAAARALQQTQADDALIEDIQTAWRAARR